MKKTTPVSPAGRKVDIPLLALNILLVSVTAGTLFFADTHFRESARAAALNDNVFLTTEWRLLMEMKNRTDRLLQDKDQEISDLRSRYEKLKRESPYSKLLAALEAQIQRAEAEREGILTARFSPAAVSDPAAGLPPAAAAQDPASPSSPALAPSLLLRSTDTPVAELLRGQIQSLEREVAVTRQAANLQEKELGDLRKRLEEALAGQAASVPAPGQGAPGQAVPGQAIPGQAIPGQAAAVLGILEQNRNALPATEAVLSLTDIKTRSLLRAIVRTPAIRAEYPDLMESLDRYFSLYGSAESLKGKREAYDEALAAVQALLDQ